MRKVDPNIKLKHYTFRCPPATIAEVKLLADLYGTKEGEAMRTLTEQAIASQMALNPRLKEVILRYREQIESSKLLLDKLKNLSK